MPLSEELKCQLDKYFSPAFPENMLQMSHCRYSQRVELKKEYDYEQQESSRLKVCLSLGIKQTLHLLQRAQNVELGSTARC